MQYFIKVRRLRSFANGQFVLGVALQTSCSDSAQFASSHSCLISIQFRKNDFQCEMLTIWLLYRRFGELIQLTFSRWRADFQYVETGSWALAKPPRHWRTGLRRNYSLASNTMISFIPPALFTMLRRHDREPCFHFFWRARGLARKSREWIPGNNSRSRE